MIEKQKPDEPEQESQPAPAGTAKPPIQKVVLPQQRDPREKTQESNRGTDPTKPLFVEIVGGEELEPFEEQTLAISRRTYWVAILAFGAALAAAVFVGSQVKIMSYQTQIMASQSESAAAGASIAEKNTREQLAIAAEQTKALENQVVTLRMNFAKGERPVVVAAIIKPYLQVGSRIRADVFWGNYGKSTALRVKGRGQVFFGKTAMEDAYKSFSPEALLPYPKDVGGVILPPNIPVNETAPDAHRSTLLSDNVTTQPDIDCITRD